jgi:hypothetical protein
MCAFINVEGKTVPFLGGKFYFQISRRVSPSKNRTEFSSREIND